MKHIILLVFSLNILLVSCTEKSKTKVSQTAISVNSILEIPNTTVDKSALYYDNKISQWTLNDAPFSGYAVSFYEDSTLKEKVGILNGRKENQSFLWHPDGHLRQIANYHEGNLHGEKKVWSDGKNHVLLSQLNYNAGSPHGEQKKWYPTGELHQKINLDMGQEKGIQQAFRENGDLYANYEAKNGREFGLKKASLCYGLKDEKVQRSKKN
ncbi:MAG: membrane-binding protein [Spirosomaceae bacterium]|nr:membrane-binding protein [Spirosomataceae bacterium]